MKATGIVRRIDGLGRVVIPKEIRRTMHIREGDPLEILPVSDEAAACAAAVAAPILSQGNVMGPVLFLATDDKLPGEAEYKLSQTVAAFLGKHLES